MAMRDMPGTPEPSRQMGHKGLDNESETGMPLSGMGKAGGLNERQGEDEGPGSRIAGAARDRARTAFHEQQLRAADRLGGVAQALHRAAGQLAAENQGPVARLADTAADRVERFADTLRRRDVDDLVGQIEGYARRQPEVFIGGAFALGFLLARFVKSSGERRQHRGGSPMGSRAGSSDVRGERDAEYGRGYGAYTGGYDTGGADTGGRGAGGYQPGGYGIGGTGGAAGSDRGGYAGSRPDIAGAYPAATGGVTSTAEIPGERTADTIGRAGDERGGNIATDTGLGATTASGAAAGAAGDNTGLEKRADEKSERGVGNIHVSENPPGATGERSTPKRR